MATLSLTAAASTITTSIPAAAAHGDLDCEVPPSMEPLFALLDSLVQLTFVLGLSLGLLGFMAAGVAFMIPGEDNNRRGKQIAKAVFIGMLLLLSAHFIVSFLVNELGGVVCQ